MAQVTLNNLDKSYGDTQILHGINLEIQDGEFAVLVGPSGCGKSTTLRIIAGLEEASGGDVYIGDTRVNDVEPKNRDIAMVFQNYALYPHMNVYENMAFGLRLRKYADQDIKERVEEAAEILSIEEYLYRRPKELSGGQRQRVAVGRAIVRKPAVFLFDEPLSNLDAKLRVQMRTEIKKLHARLKTTMIYVTHDQVEAMTMGDRIVVMKDGYIMQADEPLKIYKRPQNHFVASFIGSPAMNFFEVEVKGKQLVNPKFTLAIDAKHPEALKSYEGRKLKLGIRPEHFQLRDTPSSISASLEVSELMGNESYLYCSTGLDTFIARVADNAPRTIGTPLRLFAEPDAFQFFDMESGERIE
ncbi:MAG: sn-glycerol-3-phosphate ABC transporter ATP-binding protein UgpC [Candidatus Marinimicrobia bacterium]|nr:sn-glycerol-3-phosphate ABC transporter ATP-binding protein UgpC [Candidatus Neomarinimicrobiota bacterium]MCF7923295.1 sn-glycerol-3-phosphate ABC transporter ATP-binding protein UgpC [Candidatus Neomarinimicrobiota bacterium]